ncbi:hypothetical protein AVEN_151795-1 [Araneus ventricosus]|uniref:Uncharacterized protein n=1 Tax=Araneus ventricosus TaxID=182803 RepID=A0A4Y2SZZ7_ARAVE|nr:hypothetical protein AVEN_151795-1 [Araneus ventricosus]
MSVRVSKDFVGLTNIEFNCCSLHKTFSSQFIIKEDLIVRDDGSELVVPTKIWKLTNDAYPSIFPNQPSYLPHEPSTSRKSPSERITALKLRDEQNFAEWCTNDTVNSFEIFQETYAKKLGDGWLNIRTDNFVLCYRLDISQCPSIVVSMKIYKDLTVEIWHDSVLLKTKSYHFILGEHNKCDRWTKFDSLLSWLAAFKPNDVKPNEKIENAMHLIKDAYSQQDDSDKTLFFNNNKSALPLEKRKELGLPGKGGKLTKETQFALQFTTKSLIDIANHIFKEHTPEYILLGKFQTDSLEARFGQYRQMSGGNYNVSCLQIFESEKKIKIVNWKNFHSEKKGEFHIKSLEIFEATSEEFEVDEEFYEVFDTTTDVEISPEEMPAFIYISGYVAKKVSQKLNCDLCTSQFITTKGLEYEIDTACKYVSLLDRGGLKWPTKYTLEILVESYQIFNKLIRKEFEKEFLKANNHKQLLEHLVFEKMELLNSVPEVSCECKNNFVLIVKQCISISANIFF